MIYDDVFSLLNIFSQKAVDPAFCEAICSFLCERYPEYVKSEVIGYSLLNRPLTALRIGEGEKSTLYVGTHHGSEHITTALLLVFAADLCHAAVFPDACGFPVKKLLSECRVIIVPMLNPDGADIAIHGFSDKNAAFGASEDFRHWQANARGVDLNHNYDAGFHEYKIIESKLGISAGRTRYSGEFPLSEPETSAFCAYISKQNELSLILAFHSQGEEIFLNPDNMRASAPDINIKNTALERYERIAAMLSRLSGYKSGFAEGIASFGGLADWGASVGIPSFTIECGRGKNPLPQGDVIGVYARLREMLMRAPLLP